MAGCNLFLCTARVVSEGEDVTGRVCACACFGYHEVRQLCNTSLSAEMRGDRRGYTPDPLGQQFPARTNQLRASRDKFHGTGQPSCLCRCGFAIGQIFVCIFIQFSADGVLRFPFLFSACEQSSDYNRNQNKVTLMCGNMYRQVL